MAVLLKPQGKDNGYLVALCDGHGMGTPGKRTPYIPELKRQIRENEFNRKVVSYLSDILLAHGFRVLLVAPTDADTPLTTRTNEANRYKADIYVSVHYNAMSYTFNYSSASGISIHVYPGNLNMKSGKLARAVGKYLRQGTKQKWRGIKEDNFHVLRETKMPAILTENGFMDDPTEARLMIKDSFQKEVAREHAQGICDYFGVKYQGEKEKDTVIATGTPKDFDTMKMVIDKKYRKEGLTVYSKPTFDKKYKVGTEYKGFDEILGKYNVNGSPMYKVSDSKGKILYVSAHTEYSFLAHKNKEVERMEKNVFIVNSFKDIAAAEKAAIRNDGVIKFRHNAEDEKVYAQENIFICGGGKSGIQIGEGKVVDLTGDTSEKTAEKVFSHFDLT